MVGKRILLLDLDFKMLLDFVKKKIYLQIDVKGKLFKEICNMYINYTEA